MERIPRGAAVRRPQRFFMNCPDGSSLSPSMRRPVRVKTVLFLCRADSRFPRKEYAPGCPRNDDSHLGRPTASPVLSARLAFHKKAGQSQDCFVFTSMDSLPLGRAASVAILPSAVCSERFSLAARWAYSIQSVLRPDYRPRLLSIGRELGQDFGAVTGSRRLSSAVTSTLS